MIMKGNKILSEIFDNYRIPVVVFTGTPEKVDNALFKVYTKGEAEIEIIIKDLIEKYDFDFFNIIGHSGIIEKKT